MTIYSGTPPDYAPISGAEADHVRDANTGDLFWTCQVAIPGAPPEQHVYRFVPSTGKSTFVPLEKTVTGRGKFAVLNGTLYLDAWNEAETPKKWYLIPVPDCKRPEPLQADTQAIAALQQQIDGLALTETQQEVLRRMAVYFGLE